MVLLLQNDPVNLKKAEVEGTSENGAFYGDIVNIPENSSDTVYAIAYVETADGIAWSEVQRCTPDWKQHFTGLDENNQNGGE